MDGTKEPAIKKTKKTKVLKDWEDEDIFKLISMVENEQCIWNAGVNGYHNKTMRDNAWRKISECLNKRYDQLELNAKWTNLRIQFRSYSARAKTKSGQGALEPIKWKFFIPMSFIGRAEDQQTQETISNLLFETESDSSSHDASATTIPLSSPKQSAPTTNRSKQQETQSASAQIADTMRQAVEAMKERNQNVLDPNISFANYLVSELKTLSEDAASAVRKRVTMYFLQCLEDENK